MGLDTIIWAVAGALCAAVAAALVGNAVATAMTYGLDDFARDPLILLVLILLALFVVMVVLAAVHPPSRRWIFEDRRADDL